MTQPNQDKVGERIEKYIHHLPDCNLCQAHTGEVFCSCGLDQALLQIKEAMKVDEGEIAEVIICRMNKADFKVGRLGIEQIAHSICDYLEGRLG